MARPQSFNTDAALDKALGVFWSKGYEGASMADLLDATGLSKSSLYGVFGGKRELFLTAFDAYRGRRVSEMHQILAEGQGRAAIETFFRKIIDDARSPEFFNGCMSTNQAVELAPHDPEIRSRVERDFQLIEDTLASTIARGKEDGSVTTGQDPRRLARLLVVAFPGLQVMVRAQSPTPRLRDALDLLLENLD